MMSMELEKEFEFFKLRHKITVLKTVITKFYEDLQDANTVNLPDFIRNDTPEKLADKELDEIFYNSNDKQRFEFLYNKAWEQIGEIID